MKDVKMGAIDSNRFQILDNENLIAPCLGGDIKLGDYLLKFKEWIDMSDLVRYSYRIKKSRTDLGYIDLSKSTWTTAVVVSAVNIFPCNQGNGYKIYHNLGDYLVDNGLEFRSSREQNGGALKIWERLYSEGSAELLNDDPDPTRRQYIFIKSFT